MAAMQSFSMMQPSGRSSEACSVLRRTAVPTRPIAVIRRTPPSWTGKVSQRKSAVKEKSSNGVLRKVKTLRERKESPLHLVCADEAQTQSEVV